MEIVLSEIKNYLRKKAGNVLILVIVEIVLSGLLFNLGEWKKDCLNPCYSGNCIEWRVKTKQGLKTIFVLILVIVEIVLSGSYFKMRKLSRLVS